MCFLPSQQSSKHAVRCKAHRSPLLGRIIGASETRALFNMHVRPYFTSFRQMCSEFRCLEAREEPVIWEEEEEVEEGAGEEGLGC